MQRLTLRKRENLSLACRSALKNGRCFEYGTIVLDFSRDSSPCRPFFARFALFFAYHGWLGSRDEQPGCTDTEREVSGLRNSAGRASPTHKKEGERLRIARSIAGD
jgi:hypothetical protein